MILTLIKNYKSSGNSSFYSSRVISTTRKIIDRTIREMYLYFNVFKLRRKKMDAINFSPVCLHVCGTVALGLVDQILMTLFLRKARICAVVFSYLDKIDLVV